MLPIQIYEDKRQILNNEVISRIDDVFKNV